MYNESLIANEMSVLHILSCVFVCFAMTRTFLFFEVEKNTCGKKWGKSLICCKHGRGLGLEGCLCLLRGENKNEQNLFFHFLVLILVFGRRGKKTRLQMGEKKENLCDSLGVVHHCRFGGKK